jgi:nucleoside-diphosphate-sugar epimerase
MGGLRVLLFGASGFLGGAVGTALEADERVGEVLRVTSRPGTDRPGWLVHDLSASSATGLASLLQDLAPDVVVNCVGALTGTEEALVAANVLVTARILDAAALASPRTRFVTIGSAAEYGVVPAGVPVSEDAPTRPVGTYGITKLASTQLVRLAGESGRVDGVVLRVFNPIGPGVPVESLLGRAAVGIRSAQDDAGEVRLGPLGASRDFVDVRDVGRAVAAAALAPVLRERVLNIGSGVATRARDAVAGLAAIAGYDGAIHEADPPPARSAAVDWIAADISRARGALGWTPRYDLQSSLEAIWQGEGPARAHAPLSVSVAGA